MYSVAIVGAFSYAAAAAWIRRHILIWRISSLTWREFFVKRSLNLPPAGCTYLEIDDVNFAYLCDPKMREGAKKIGEDPDKLPALYAKLINECIKDRPANMSVCTHLCRGNFRSAWVAEGGYDPVAEVLFNDLKVDGYFLEFDTPRARKLRAATLPAQRTKN